MVNSVALSGASDNLSFSTLVISIRINLSTSYPTGQPETLEFPTG